MRSPRDFTAVEEFRESWVKCLQVLGMLSGDDFEGLVRMVSEDLTLCREWRQNQALNQQTIPLPLDSSLDEVKFELGQIGENLVNDQMGISNFIDSNLFDNVGNLLEEDLLGNDTIPTLKENLRPAGPFESLGSDNIQGNLEVEHSFGVDFGDFQNIGLDPRFPEMSSAGSSQLQNFDSIENSRPKIFASPNAGPVQQSSQRPMLDQEYPNKGKSEENAKVWVEAKKVEISGRPVSTCGQARRERNLKAFENKSTLAAERRAKEAERRSKEMERRQVAMERKNALASAAKQNSATGRLPSGREASRSKGKDIKVLKSEFLNREPEPLTGSTGSVIQQLETSIEKMESSGVDTGGQPIFHSFICKRGFLFSIKTAACFFW